MTDASKYSKTPAEELLKELQAGPVARLADAGSGLNYLDLSSNEAKKPISHDAGKPGSKPAQSTEGDKLSPAKEKPAVEKRGEEGRSWLWRGLAGVVGFSQGVYEGGAGLVNDVQNLVAKADASRIHQAALSGRYTTGIDLIPSLLDFAKETGGALSLICRHPADTYSRLKQNLSSEYSRGSTADRARMWGQGVMFAFTLTGGALLTRGLAGLGKVSRGVDLVDGLEGKRLATLMPELRSLTSDEQVAQAGSLLRGGKTDLLTAIGRDPEMGGVPGFSTSVDLTDAPRVFGATSKVEPHFGDLDAPSFDSDALRPLVVTEHQRISGAADEITQIAGRSPEAAPTAVHSLREALTAAVNAPSELDRLEAVQSTRRIVGELSLEKADSRRLSVLLNDLDVHSRQLVIGRNLLLSEDRLQASIETVTRMVEERGSVVEPALARKIESLNKEMARLRNVPDEAERVSTMAKVEEIGSELGLGPSGNKVMADLDRASRQSFEVRQLSRAERELDAATGALKQATGGSVAGQTRVVDEVDEAMVAARQADSEAARLRAIKETRQAVAEFNRDRALTDQVSRQVVEEFDRATRQALEARQLAQAESRLDHLLETISRSIRGRLANPLSEEVRAARAVDGATAGLRMAQTEEERTRALERVRRAIVEFNANLPEGDQVHIQIIRELDRASSQALIVRRLIEAERRAELAARSVQKAMEVAAQRMEQHLSDERKQAEEAARSRSEGKKVYVGGQLRSPKEAERFIENQRAYVRNQRALVADALSAVLSASTVDQRLADIEQLQKIVAAFQANGATDLPLTQRALEDFYRAAQQAWSLRNAGGAGGQERSIERMMQAVGPDALSSQPLAIPPHSTQSLSARVDGLMPTTAGESGSFRQKLAHLGQQASSTLNRLFPTNSPARGSVGLAMVAASPLWLTGIRSTVSYPPVGSDSESAGTIGGERQRAVRTAETVPMSNASNQAVMSHQTGLVFTPAMRVFGVPDRELQAVPVQHLNRPEDVRDQARPIQSQQAADGEMHGEEWLRKQLDIMRYGVIWGYNRKGDDTTSNTSVPVRGVAVTPIRRGMVGEGGSPRVVTPSFKPQLIHMHAERVGSTAKRSHRGKSAGAARLDGRVHGSGTLLVDDERVRQLYPFLSPSEPSIQSGARRIFDLSKVEAQEHRSVGKPAAGSSGTSTAAVDPGMVLMSQAANSTGASVNNAKDSAEA